MTVSVLESIEVDVDSRGIARVAEWAETQAAGIAPDIAFASRLCVEEATTNIMLYAFDSGPTGQRLRVGCGRQGELVAFVIEDHGRAFDPVSAPDESREGSIADATVTGRGIRLMRQFSKDMRYERIGDVNRLTLWFG